MADEIIDLTRYLKKEPVSDLPRGSMALWGAEGERSRFALPLWRIIYLAQAERGMIVSHDVDAPRSPKPFVVLDLAADPARTDVDASWIPRFGLDEGPSLVELDDAGIVVYLGSRGRQLWTLLVDGVQASETPLTARAREDILFLSGECAGLLFLRDLADAVVPPEAPDGDDPTDCDLS